MVLPVAYRGLWVHAGTGRDAGERGHDGGTGHYPTDLTKGETGSEVPFHNNITAISNVIS